MSDIEGSSVPPLVIEAFQSAAITALQELTQFEGVAEITNPAEHGEGAAAVSATVRLARPVPGSMTVVFPVEVAALLAVRYLPPDAALTDEIVDDVAGEFANVIAGQAKTMLKGTPYHFTMSTPVVARLANPSLLQASAPGMATASIAFEAGRLRLLIALPPCAGA